MTGTDFFSGGIDTILWIVVNGGIVFVVFKIVKSVRARKSRYSKVGTDSLSPPKRATQSLYSTSGHDDLEKVLQTFHAPELAVDLESDITDTGWYPDPSGKNALRFFSDGNWTTTVKRSPTGEAREEADWFDRVSRYKVHAESRKYEVAAAGWFTDPSGQFDSRFWNGSSWTPTVRNGNQEFIQKSTFPNVSEHEPELDKGYPEVKIASSNLSHPSGLVSELEALSKLFQNGMLNDVEFQLAKSKLLGH
jgi:hypothetical protein